MRYFFDVEDGSGEIPDNEGLELDSLEAAKAEAVRTLPDIAKAGLSKSDRRVVTIRVRDEAGLVLIKASLTLAVEQMQES